MNEEFLEAVKPLIKYLAEKHHPHCTVIATSTGAELVEGVMTTGPIHEFLQD